MFLLNRMKKFAFIIKSWGSRKDFKIRSGSDSGLGLLIYVKMKLKSRWTVPLNRLLCSIKFAKILHLKGQQRKIFCRRFSSWIYSTWAPDFEAARIFFSFQFSQSFWNILMNSCCSLLGGFKISAIAYCAYCHSLLQLSALICVIIFPQATAAIQN